MTFDPKAATHIPAKRLFFLAVFDIRPGFGHSGDMDEQDDVTIEPGDGESEGAEEKAGEKIAKMREELGTCRKEKQEYMDGWQRAKADYVNLLKRFEPDAKMAELKGRV